MTAASVLIQKSEPHAALLATQPKWFADKIAVALADIRAANPNADESLVLEAAKSFAAYGTSSVFDDHTDPHAKTLLRVMFAAKALADARSAARLKVVAPAAARLRVAQAERVSV